MATGRHLVVVASAEPSNADALADLLRDSFTVRTAYSTGEVVDRLDAEVDVVLVDPALSEEAVATVGDALAERGLNCQVGMLAAAPDGPTDRVDAVVSPAVPDAVVRDDVEQLAIRARFRKTLEEYYDLARSTAQLRDDAGLREDRERLQQRLEHLGHRLDEVAEPLDPATLFRTALDAGIAAGDGDDDAGAQPSERDDGELDEGAVDEGAVDESAVEGGPGESVDADDCGN